MSNIINLLFVFFLAFLQQSDQRLFVYFVTFMKPFTPTILLVTIMSFFFSLFCFVFMFFSHAHDKTKNIFLYFFYRAQNLPSFLFYLDHCNEPKPWLTMESQWLSGIAAERGFRRSEVRFLMGNPKFFFFRRSRQDRKHPSIYLELFLKFCDLIKRCIPNWIFP